MAKTLNDYRLEKVKSFSKTIKFPDKRSRWKGENRKFYNSPVWRSLRKLILKRDPLCTSCILVFKLVKSEVVDHIVAWDSVRPQDRRFYQLCPDNLRGLCVSCHNRFSSISKKLSQRSFNFEKAD